MRLPNASTGNSSVQQQPLWARVWLWFGRYTHDQLAANSWKGGWDTMAPSWLLRRLRAETNELARAIKHPEDPEHIVREAADVANFAMFIADKFRPTSGMCVTHGIVAPNDLGFCRQCGGPLRVLAP